MYSTAAKKLNTEWEDIQNCVFALVNLLLISCRHKVLKKNYHFESTSLDHLITVK